MSYEQAYTAFIAALDALEAAAATLQAAEHNQSGRPPNPYAHSLVSHLQTARIHRSIRLPELRTALAP